MDPITGTPTVTPPLSPGNDQDNPPYDDLPGHPGYEGPLPAGLLIPNNEALPVPMIVPEEYNGLIIDLTGSADSNE